MLVHKQVTDLLINWFLTFTPQISTGLWVSLVGDKGFLGAWTLLSQSIQKDKVVC